SAEPAVPVLPARYQRIRAQPFYAALSGHQRQGDANRDRGARRLADDWCSACRSRAEAWSANRSQRRGSVHRHLHRDRRALFIKKKKKVWGGVVGVVLIAR